MNHSFNVNAAKELGVNAAILLENLAFWCQKNAADERHVHDGLAYTYCSLGAFEELFPYLTGNAIRGALKKLEKEGYVVTGCFNRNTHDRTKWYACTERTFSLLSAQLLKSTDARCENPQMQGAEIHRCICGDPQMDLLKSTDGSVKNNTCNISTDINTDINLLKKKDTKEKPVNHRYGAYDNVLLSDSDLSKLQAEFPGDWADRIERLSEYIASTGKKYKNHLATLRSWARRSNDDQRARKPRTQEVNYPVEDRAPEGCDPEWAKLMEYTHDYYGNPL